MDECTWLVQATVRGETLARLQTACDRAGKPLRTIPVIPFNDALPGEMPDIPGPVVFYGYTTLILAAHCDPMWRRGIFFDPNRFCPRAYRAAWGNDFLNADARIVTIAQFAAEPHAGETLWFIRPNDDLKRFTGQVMPFTDFLHWYDGFRGATDTAVRDDTEIVVAPPQEIDQEWRLFYVGGQRVTETRYLPAPGRGIPAEVGEWADTRARLWEPVPAFVLDIAQLSSGALKIIECNCINGSGLYHADTDALVRALSRYQEATWHNAL